MVPIKVAKVILFPSKIPWVFHKESHFSGEFPSMLKTFTCLFSSCYSKRESLSYEKIQFKFKGITQGLEIHFETTRYI